MFYASIDELPDDFLKEWNERLRKFQCHGTVLPSWCIRFHGYVSENLLSEAQEIGGVGYFRYYKSKKACWICKVESRLFSAVKMSLDFNEVDVFCNNFNNMNDPAYGIYELLCQAYRYRVLKFGGVILHSSAVSYRNEGIVFFGHSGAGKSTQAKFWAKYMGAEVINFDRNYIIKQANELIVSSTPWGGKEKYFVNKSKPIKALVFVQKSLGENRVEQINKLDGFSTIYLYNYLFPFDENIEDRYCKVLESLILEIPVYILYCTYSKESVSVLFDELFKENEY